MFEHQIEDTISLLAQQAIGTDDAITLKKIQNSTIPASIVLFYEMDAARWEADELHRLMESSHFDYTAPVIREKFEEICRLSREYTRFARAEFLDTLDRSVKLLFNYVCRPQWTLTKYIFADATQAPVEIVQEKLAHFSDYEYYRVVIKEYIHSKRIATISREKFEELVGLIDNEVVRNLDSSKLARLSQPIYNLFNPGDATEFARVPIEALSIFYDDKNVSSVVSRLEIEKNTSPSLSLHELMRLVGETDFTAGLEISQIVTKHVGGTQRPAGQTVDDIARDVVDFSPEIEIPSLRIEDHDVESQSRNDLEVTLPRSFETGFEDGITAGGGEQETPAFFDDDDGEIALETLHEKDFDLPDDLYVATEAVPAMLDEAPTGLALHLEQPGAVDTKDEDDFFKQLDLSQENDESSFRSMVSDELSIPDTALVGVEETPLPHSELQRTDEEQESLLADGEKTSATDRDDEDVTLMTLDEIIATFGDLKTLIPAAEKKKYVRKLFEKSEDAYERSIDALNAKPTWRDASELIDELFFKNNIDMYSRVAVTFTDEVYKRYQRKKE